MHALYMQEIQVAGVKEVELTIALGLGVSTVAICQSRKCINNARDVEDA